MLSVTKIVHAATGQTIELKTINISNSFIKINSYKNTGNSGPGSCSVTRTARRTVGRAVLLPIELELCT